MWWCVSALIYPTIKNQAGWDGSQAIIEDLKKYFIWLLSLEIKAIIIFFF